MATVSDVLRTAATELGYNRFDDPEPGSKYGRAYAGYVGDPYFGESGVPFCAMFVSWVLHQCGVDFTYAYCPFILRDYRSQRVSVEDACPGDLVLYDWGADGMPDHVGIVEKNLGDCIQSIEGNTSSGQAGSQSNGGGVYRRVRRYGVVCTIIRMDYASGEAPTPEPGPVSSEGELGDVSWWGPAFTREMQSQRGTTVDGVVSTQPYPNTAYLVRADTDSWDFRHRVTNGSQLIASVQMLIGTTPDGWFGHQSVMALQRWLADHGYSVGDSGADGYMGADTCTAIGHALQDGAFRA